MKLPLFENHQCAIYCGASYGPTFGGNRLIIRPKGIIRPKMRHHTAEASYGPNFGGGHDLYVANCANSSTSSHTNLGHTYQLPPGQSAQTFFTGSRHFQAAEVEVYQVQLQ